MESSKIIKGLKLFLNLSLMDFKETKTAPDVVLFFKVQVVAAKNPVREIRRLSGHKEAWMIVVSIVRERNGHVPVFFTTHCAKVMNWNEFFL